MDELKKDISSDDAMFTQPYKPTLQIAEYLTARAIRQGVTPPSLLAGVDKVLGKLNKNEREEKSEEAKGAIGDQYTQWRWKIRKNGEGSTQGRNLRIGKQIMSMRHSLFS